MTTSPSSSHIADKAKQEQWHAEIAARPEISEEMLLGMFPAELIAKIDEKQQELTDKLGELLVFSVFDGASKEEGRLVDYAGNNIGMYDDEVEDLIDDDPIYAQLLDPTFRQAHADDEGYARAVRMRRTVVAHYIVSVKHQSLGSDSHQEPNQQSA